MAMSQRLKIALDYLKRYEDSQKNADKSKRLTFQKLADEHNETYGTSRGRGYIFRLLDDAKNHRAKVRKSPELRVLPPPAEQVRYLDKWEGVNDRGNKGLFYDALAKVVKDNRYVIVEHDPDIHFPYQDNDALAMRSVIRQHLQPHVIVGGSDAIDAPNISKYESDKRLPQGRTLSRFRPHWEYHVNNRYEYDAPDALKVWIDGNHCARVWEYLLEDDNYDILYDYHVDTIVQNGSVHFLGTDPEALGILIADNLLVTHGTKATVHTAKATLADVNFAHSVLVGHTHRPDYYSVGAKGVVSATVGGSACNLRPPYEKRKVYINWQHGYSYGIVDTWTGTTITKGISFVHTKDTIWCDFGGEILSVKKQAYSISEVA